MNLHINERTVVLSSLSCCLRCLKAIKNEPEQWQWAILSMHNALQSAMVCHLTGTADVGALKKVVVDKEWEWHERDRRGEIERIELGTDKTGLIHTKIVKKEDHPPSKRLAAPEVIQKTLQSEKENREGRGYSEN